MTTEARAPPDRAGEPPVSRRAASQTFDWSTMTDQWQHDSLNGLSALSVDTMPAVEVLLLDDIAAYLMGSGPLQPPYTVEHGSRIVSGLFGAIVNAASFTPAQVPAPTSEIKIAREQVVRGAHDFAGRGVDGIGHLTNRLIPAVLGELETYQASPEKQTCLIFYYALLAVASGPRNLLDDESAIGVMQIFEGWDQALGQGYRPPWRQSTPSGA